MLRLLWMLLNTAGRSGHDRKRMTSSLVCAVGIRIPNRSCTPLTSLTLWVAMEKACTRGVHAPTRGRSSTLRRATWACKRSS